jgi:small neutral amino acid transporter SnatA (MarC family)
MLLTSQAPGKMLEWIGALTVTMIVCAIVLILAEKIQQWLGERAVTAFERLMGLVLVAISVEMILTGIRTFVHQL